MQVSLIDFKVQDGMILNGFITSNNNNKILIATHGMSSNCFKEREKVIASKCVENGIDFLGYNNRGSELVKYTKKIINEKEEQNLGGTTYEDVIEGYFDIKGAILKAVELGYEEIYLQGHSLGATKTVYTYNKLKEENSELLKYIKGIILLSLIDIPRAIKVYSKEKFEEYFKFAEDKEKEKQQQVNPANRKQDPSLNYRVNLFIDNSTREGAPVIMDSNYSYHNIFGSLEYENYYGSLRTDHTMLKPGLMQQANGGYIIFQAKDLLQNNMCYEALKKALRVKELSIENATDQRSSMVMVSLKPEPIPLDLKVILIGNSNIYQTLLAVDADFRKLFKIKVEFEDDAPFNKENANKLASIIHGFCESEELPHLDKQAMSRLIEYASKIAGSHKKLSTRFDDLIQITGEAATWAKIAKSKIVTKEFIDKALSERIERVKKFDAKYMEMIKDNSLLIDTSGFEVGTLNGLTVMTIGDYSFGKPAKITVNTYTGKTGIVNIEREVELSGSSHSKGVLILTGYLGEMFAQDIPLSLTASICFEQLYNGVDGDSASSTELYGLLSSLSGIPINQSIAVTGSVNQKGQIQPIGGVNEKIDGFFQICKMRGLDGSHGVMIPIQNVDNLQLSDEIVENVKNGLFHIYAISTIEEGIEVLTGVPAGKKDKDGHFSVGTINYLVYEKLKKYAEISNRD